MKSTFEIEALKDAPIKQLEKAIGMPCRNGQASQAIRKTLEWVLK